MEKKLEGHEDMVIGCIDLEKAYNTIPKEIVMATFRWIGVPEAEVRRVDGTHKDTKSRVLCGLGRVQNKCWPETGECLELFVVCRNGGTDKQKDWLNGTTDSGNYCRRMSRQ